MLRSYDYWMQSIPTGNIMANDITNINNINNINHRTILAIMYVKMLTDL